MDATTSLTAIARILHGLPGDPHRVTSALGVWLLLATVARGAGTTRRTRLSMEPSAWHVTTPSRSLLLAAKHPAVRDAYAAWVRPDLLDRPLGTYLRGLPSRVAAGPMPTQCGADDWVTRETMGLLSSFPVTLGPDTYAAVATVLATTVSWLESFGTATSARLGDGPFAGAVERVLTAHTGDGHDAWLAETAVGRVGVHVGHSDGLDVWSVIGDESVPAEDLLG
jgi:hypothetical protein